MRVGVYVDGFNLYYGARDRCGRGTAGWRWLDVRRLATYALPLAWRDSGAAVGRVVYCTARVSGVDDPSTPRDHNVYLRALRAAGSVDHIEFGSFVRRTKAAPLAIRSGHGKPELVKPRWPVVIHDHSGRELSDARFLVSFLDREEKGSDVNLATHVLLDIASETVDAVVVISNDSDLELPLRRARERVPVGLINPGSRPVAGKLKDSPAAGVGGHWWGQLTQTSYLASQMPEQIGRLVKPNGW